MTRPSTRQVVAAMWMFRPSVPELMFTAIALLLTHLAVDVPLPVLSVAVTLIVVGGTLGMALAHLHKMAVESDVLPAEEGDDAAH